MKIDVKNFGPIKHVEIDTAKAMTMIVGENATGKTYLSILIYAILNDRLHGLLDIFSQEKIRDIFEKNRQQNNLKFSVDIKNIMHADDDIIELEYSKRIPFIDDVFPPGDSQKLFKDTVITINDLKKTILECIKLHGDEVLSEGVLRCRIQKDSTIVAVEIIHPEASASVAALSYIFGSETSVTSLSSTLLSAIDDFVTKKMAQQFFFPAERAAIHMFNTELSIRRSNTVDELLALESRAGGNKEQTSEQLHAIRETLSQNKRYPLPIRNSLSFADDIAFISSQEGPLAYLAKQIEEDLLKGTLTVDKNGQVWFFGNRAKTKKVSLDITASSTKVLAGLVLYVRYKASKGMTIFIDEPELNLHPNMQVQMARVLVRIMNAGVKLFVSTHSDYIVREINNMIVAKETGDTEYYEEGLHLDRNNIDIVRLFYRKDNSRQADSEKVPIEEDGFTVKTVDAVIVEQNNTNDSLCDLLESTDE